MNGRLIHAGAAAALVLLAGGCKTASALLLPGEGTNPVGALVVLNKDGSETPLDEANSAARLGSGKATVKRNVAVKPAYQELINSLPPPAVPYTLTGFKNGEDEIPPDQMVQLDNILILLQNRPGAEVQVTGHTDTVDDQEINDRVSEKRALAVVEQLVKQGFKREQLSAVGRGERELKVQTPDSTPNEENRRVEIIVR